MRWKKGQTSTSDNPSLLRERIEVIVLVFNKLLKLLLFIFPGMYFKNYQSTEVISKKITPLTFHHVFSKFLSIFAGTHSYRFITLTLYNRKDLEIRQANKIKIINIKIININLGMEFNVILSYN